MSPVLDVALWITDAIVGLFVARTLFAPTEARSETAKACEFAIASEVTIDATSMRPDAPAEPPILVVTDGVVFASMKEATAAPPTAPAIARPRAVVAASSVVR